MGSDMERGATAVLQGITRMRWGFPARLMAPLVHRMGPVRALGWFLWNLPRYERLLARFGAVRVHLLATAISLVNGCEYCGYGHGYALELTYLREHGTAFPLRRAELVELCGQPPATIRRRLMSAAQTAGLHGDAAWLDRAIELAANPELRPVDRDELTVAFLVRMFGVLNGVGIADATEPDHAHDAANKDGNLKQRLRALSAA